MSKAFHPASVFTTAADIEEAKKLYQLWQELAAEKPRCALNPVSFGAALLPRLSLLSRIDGDDFRYDLIGNELERCAPRLKPGSRAGGIRDKDPTRTFILDQLNFCANDARPRAYWTDFVSIDNREIAVISIAFPLDIEDGQAGSILIAIWQAQYIGAWRRDKRLVEPFVDVEAWLS